MQQYISVCELTDRGNCGLFDNLHLSNTLTYLLTHWFTYILNRWHQPHHTCCSSLHCRSRVHLRRGVEVIQQSVELWQVAAYKRRWVSETGRVTVESGAWTGLQVRRCTWCWNQLLLLNGVWVIDGLRHCDSWWIYLPVRRTVLPIQPIL